MNIHWLGNKGCIIRDFKLGRFELSISNRPIFRSGLRKRFGTSKAALMAKWFVLFW